MVKSAVFEVEKPFEMGPDLQKFWKKRQISRYFEGENSLDMGRGFRAWVAYPYQKIIQVPLPWFSLFSIMFPINHNFTGGRETEFQLSFDIWYC